MRCEWCGSDHVPAGKKCWACGSADGQPPPGRGEGEILMTIVGLVRGGRSHLDGLYLKDYDPHKQGFDPTGRPMIAVIEGTSDPAEALHFSDMLAARAEWMRWDGNVRVDGKPSRPLLAFNVQFTRGTE